MKVLGEEEDQEEEENEDGILRRTNIANRRSRAQKSTREEHAR